MIAGHGELWSAQMLNAYMKSNGISSRWLDARLVLIVTLTEKQARVIDWDVSQKKFDQWIAQAKTDYVVITGYVASTPDGIATTLKRNGSDFQDRFSGALHERFVYHDLDGRRWCIEC